MNIQVMDKNMQCRGFQFEIGKEYEIDTKGRPLKLCTDTVFEYFKTLRQAHAYYDCRSEDNRYFEIETLGEEVTDGEKYGSNHIKIVREIVGTELEFLKGLTGNNTGLFNSGFNNSGDFNSGDGNSGNKNSGDFNSGSMNSGNLNSGDLNSGNLNDGHWNSGNMNNGCWNSGDRNLGDGNSGNLNSGKANSGFMNRGNGNSGNRNLGHNNSGFMNCGDSNSGFANKCNASNGVFCNENDQNIRIFNKPSNMSLIEFFNSRYWEIIHRASFRLTEWVEYTDEEKAADPEKKQLGGYLKSNSYEETWAKWWAELSEEDKQIIQEIPNFDPEVFRDITGIIV